MTLTANHCLAGAKGCRARCQQLAGDGTVASQPDQRHGLRSRAFALGRRYVATVQPRHGAAVPRAYLRDGPAHNLSPVTVYNTGANRWEHFDDWRIVCERGCPQTSKPLYLQKDAGLSFDRPSGGASLADTYISDPAKPVPYIPRPIVDPFSNMAGGSWSAWGDMLVTDQRFVDGRSDVLTYATPVLTSPVKVTGIPVVDLRAMTTGTDGDFVVKLIDVYPADYPTIRNCGVSSCRWRWTSCAAATARASSMRRRSRPNEAQQYKFELRTSTTCSSRGIDHGPGSVDLVPAVRSQSADLRAEHFNARPGDYRKRRFRCYARGAALAILLAGRELATRVQLDVRMAVRRCEPSPGSSQDKARTASIRCRART